MIAYSHTAARLGLYRPPLNHRLRLYGLNKSHGTEEAPMWLHREDGWNITSERQFWVEHERTAMFTLGFVKHLDIWPVRHCIWYQTKYTHTHFLILGCSKNTMYFNYIKRSTFVLLNYGDNSPSSTILAKKMYTLKINTYLNMGVLLSAFICQDIILKIS